MLLRVPFLLWMRDSIYTILDGPRLQSCRSFMNFFSSGVNPLWALRNFTRSNFFMSLWLCSSKYSVTTHYAPSTFSLHQRGCSVLRMIPLFRFGTTGATPFPFLFLHALWHLISPLLYSFVFLIFLWYSVLTANPWNFAYVW